MNTRFANFNILYLFIFFILLPVCAQSVFAQDELTASENNFSIKVGDKEPKKISLKVNKAATDAQPATSQPADNVTCKWDEGKDYSKFATVKSVEGATGEITIAPQSSTSEFFIFLKCERPETTPILIFFKVSPQDTNAALVVKGENTQRDKIVMLKDQTIFMELKNVPEAVLAKADINNQAVDVSTANGIVTLIAKQKSSAPILLVAKNKIGDISINGKPNIELTIVEATVSDRRSVNVGSDLNIFGNVISFDPPGFENKNLTVPLTFKEIGSAASVNADKLSLKGMTQSKENFISIISAPGEFKPNSFKVEVVSSPSGLEVKTNGTNTVYVNEKLTLSTLLKDEQGQSINNANITWALEDAADSSYIMVPQSGNIIEVMGLSATATDRPIWINVRAQAGAATKTDRIAVFVRGKRNVIGFENVSVRVDILDNRMTRDLFGTPANKEFHIAKIRIVNNLTSNQSGGPGSSILFFSDGLEVRVALEKKFIGNRKKLGNATPPEGWQDITADDVRYINAWNSCPLPETRRQFESDLKTSRLSRCEREFEAVYESCVQDNIIKETDKQSDKDLKASRLRQCRAKVESDKIACRQAVVAEYTLSDCKSGDTDCEFKYEFCKEMESNPQSKTTKGHWIAYRPYIFQVVANTHDRRNDRTWRNRFFLGANSLSMMTSFITSFAVPGSGNDLPVGLDKFQNFFIPTAEKLFPSMRETQRQNIITEVLPPIVEVAYGNDVSKYVFFPKKEIEGVLPDYDVRISSISIFKIKSEVGIVQKGSVQQVRP